jgi:glycosyltransferase involved in cell wall biosynthesis
VAEVAPLALQIVQPVVPDYRLPLFDLLFERLDGRLRVTASRCCFDAPPSVSVARPYLDLEHRCVRLGAGYWQLDLRLWDGLGPGGVLVMNANPRFLSGFALAGRARRRGTALVLWGHAWSPTSRPWRARLRRALWRQADSVLVYTEAERSRLAPALGAVVVHAAQNALDQSAAGTAARAWTSERLAGFQAANGLTGRHTLLFCGRLRSRPSTELAIALAAIAGLPAAVRRDVLLVVAGDGDERVPLVALARELGIDGQVRWLGAVYGEDNLAPWFLSARAFVYPGAIGLSLLHAFGYGLPVITHADAEHHNPEFAALRDGVNGLVHRRGDANDLRRVLQTVLDPAWDRQACSAAARATVEVEYTLESMAERILAACRTARDAARFRRTSTGGP